MGFRWFVALLLLSGQVGAQSSPNAPRPRIGVALQGGGAKGLAHIGVLRWFEQRHIPIDYIAGTSMGGLVGGLYATGHEPSEIQEIVEQINWGNALSGGTPFRDLAFRRKEDLRAFPNALELGLRHGLRLPGGLNSGQQVQTIIDRYMLPYSDRRNFDDLPVPFRCVAADLVSGRAKVFQSGSLSTALRATMSLPGVFAPVREGDKVYADGGLLDNLPTDVVRQMGADIVIGIHLSTGPVDPKSLGSLFAIAGGSTDVMIEANVLRGMESADILVTVNVAGYGTLDFSRAQEIIGVGYGAAHAKEKVLASFSLDETKWRDHLAQRESRRAPPPPEPQFVAVEGAPPNLAKDIGERLASFGGEPIQTARLEQRLEEVMGLGRFDSLSYSLVDRNSRPGLLITAREKIGSPPWLKPGFVVNGADPYDVQFALGGRLTFLDVGGYRSEVRADFSFGSVYGAALEYYHPLTPLVRWFISPHFSANSSPLNLYSKENLLAEYRLKYVDGGLDFGYAIDRFSEVRLGYQVGYLSASRRIGSPLLPSVAGRTGATRLRYVMDRLDSPTIPRSGVSLLGVGQWIDSNPGASIAFPSAEVRISAFQPVGSRGSIYMMADGGSTFGRERTGLPQFSLGGPARLAAYGPNEFLTNEYFYFRLGYLHKIAEMPSFLGKGVYLDGHLELARPYDLPNVSGLKGDAVAGLALESVLGPIYFGGSAGPSGHRSWFFQLGRIF